jgi:hypothetical protein
MKHLKLFEGFDKSQYYHEIEYSEYMSYLTNDSNNTTLRRIQFDWDLYRKCLSLFDEDKWGVRGPYYSNDEDRRRRLEPICLIMKNSIDSISVDISLLGDEWFLVGIEDYRKGRTYPSGRGQMGPVQSYWKCDQFEGLVELLKDKGIIK